MATHERASRFITIKAPGTSIGKDSGNPGGGVRVLLAEAVRIMSGFGGWDIVPRPRKTGLTLWQGFEPITLEIPVLFRTLSNEWDDGKRIEADCDDLAKLAGRGKPSPEPQKRGGKVSTVKVKKGQTAAKVAQANKVDLGDLLQLNNLTDPSKVKRGMTLTLPVSKETEPFGQPPVCTIIADGNLVPFNDLEFGDDTSLDRKQWIIQDIDWGATRRNIYGDRIRQNATITVVEYVAPKVVATKPAPWRRSAKHVRGKSKASKGKSKK